MPSQVLQGENFGISCYDAKLRDLSDCKIEQMFSFEGDLRDAEHIQRREARLCRRVPPLPHLRLPQGKDLAPSSDNYEYYDASAP